MTPTLPAPPEDLSPDARSFYDELNRMIEATDPRDLDPDRTWLARDDAGYQLQLGHRSREDWDITASISEGELIVESCSTHEHFFAPPIGSTGERPWTTQAVDFIAELFRGEIEIRTVFRGDKPISVEQVAVGSGRRGWIGMLTPSRLAWWRPRRTKVERPSFRPSA